MTNVDRSEVAAGVAAFLIIFAPAIHKLGIDQYVNLDLTNTTLLIALVIGVGAYLLHRSGKAA
jgi:multisubunit Na+/H+ antiporter MnhG subunit